MNVLISGGAGFIGSHLALVLQAQGYGVTVLDNLHPQIHGPRAASASFLYRQIANKVTFIQGDVTNRSDWEKSLRGQDAVVHLAAETGTGQSMYRVAHYTEVNVGGIALLLDILANSPGHGVRKIVLASSRAVYGEGKYLDAHGQAVYPPPREADDLANGLFDIRHPVTKDTLQVVATDEAAAVHPTSVYGLNKLHQEQLLNTVCPTIGVSPVVLRYQNVYGPGQSLHNPYTGILSIFSTLIQQGRKINIFEDGLESRDFVYIDDVVEATALALLREEANGQVFNVGTGVPTTVMEVAESLVRHFGKPTRLQVSGNFRLGDIRHNFADISRLQNVLDYTPKTSFQAGIGSFVDWVKRQEVGESNYEESLREMVERGLMK